ncbi:MbcA/ParS/Xre antitoxin family protein [Glycocaulis sp.]|uniref:MbcA/ParS/Xre antitoxin family protein n=1 Tax=Glycocaulis sp. TaxID=1969725 RepID=UPI003F6EDEEE
MGEDSSRTKAAPDEPLITEAEAAALARTAVRLFEKWTLTDDEACAILGGLSSSTFARWKQGKLEHIDYGLAMRLSLLLGIQKRLRHLFTDPWRGYAWVKKPNQVLGGFTPVEIMKQGDIASVVRIREYLDAESGGR